MLREPRPEDAAAIAELVNAGAHALHGEAEVTAAEIRDWFAYEDVAMRVVEEDGALLAYGDVQLEQDGAKAWLDVHEHPAHPGAAGPLWAELEGVARAGAVVRAVVAGGDTAIERQLRARRYEVVRSSYRMRVALDGATGDPPAPAGYAIRPLRPGEERRAYEVQQASFADHWEFEPEPWEAWAASYVRSDSFDPSLWLLAERGEEAAGVAVCRLAPDGDPRHGFVRALGVLPAHRRRGLGEALLRHAFAAFARRGCTRVSLGVDAESTTGAVRLYERAGMEVVRRSDVWERRR